MIISINKYRQNNFETSYLKIFVFAVILTFTPIKIFGYILPFSIVILLILINNSGYTLKRFLLVISFIVLYILASFCFSSFGQGKYLITNSFVSLLTYSALIFPFCIPSKCFEQIKIIRKSNRIEKVNKFLLGFLVFEGTWGIVQFYITQRTENMLPSDSVQGTFHPFSFLSDNPGFGNQFFAANVCMLLIIIFPYVVKDAKRLALCLVPLYALILSDVGHIFYTLILTIFIVGIFFLSRKALKLIILLIPIGLFIIFTYSNIMNSSKVKNNIQFTAEKEINSILLHYIDIYLHEYDRSPKTQAFHLTLEGMRNDYPESIFWGFGLGQYGSRSGLLCSRDQGQLPEFIYEIPGIGVPIPYKEYLRPLWIHFMTDSKTFGFSTMSRPCSSILSFGAEIGLIPLLVLILFIIGRLIKLRTIYIKHNLLKIKNELDLPIICFSIIIFIFFTGIFENYYETPSAIFPSIMLIRYFYSTVMINQKMNETNSITFP